VRAPTGGLAPTAGGSSDFATSSVTVVPTPSLDVDANGKVDVRTDGAAILRHLFGFTGHAMVHGTVDPVGSRTDPSEIAEFLDYYRDAVFDVNRDGKADALFDVDASGKVDALTDGVVILRYLSGFRGDLLVNGAVDPGGTRTDPDEITAFLEGFFPPQPAATAGAASNSLGASLAASAARNYFFADLGSSSGEKDEEADDPLSVDLPIVLYYDPQ